MPTRRKGAGFGFADYTANQQVGIIEGRTVSVRQRIAEFAALMNRTGRFGRDMGGDAAGKRELLEQLLHSFGVLRDVGVDLAVSAFQIGVGDQTWATRPGPVT